LAAMPVSTSYLLSGQLHKGLQQVNQTLNLIKAGIEGVRWVVMFQTPGVFPPFCSLNACRFEQPDIAHSNGLRLFKLLQQGAGCRGAYYTDDRGGQNPGKHKPCSLIATVGIKHPCRQRRTDDAA